MELSYHSTRGQAPALDFDNVLLTGLAPDGGLYVPDTCPTLSGARFEALRGLPYETVAEEVMGLFAPHSELHLDEAYRS